MAALSITATQVQPGSDAVRVDGTAGATITAGQPVYRDPTTRKWLLADADSATAQAHTVEGIALHGASDGQPLAVQSGGSITIGAAAAMTVGKVYVGGSTPGAINPDTDVVTGWYVSVLGVAISASVLKLAINNAGVAAP